MNKALAALSLLLAAGSAPAQEVVAVMSATPGPFQAACAAFSAALGRKTLQLRAPVRTSALERARVVVAFGGDAALQPYPERATLIATLAPGVAGRQEHPGPFVFVTMKPAPEALLGRLRELQPGLKRLAVLTSSRDGERYVGDLRRAAATLGLEIVVPKLAGADGVPDALRALVDKADALWLAPDPGLVTPDTFQTIRQFSWDHKVPFYAPTAGLAAAGAAAALAVDPEDAGRQAADLARRALDGEELPAYLYPDKVRLTVNLPSAAKAGLTPSGEALGKADKVLR